jgi:hypothetical protein
MVEPILSATSRNEPVPFTPSWIDRLILWIDHRPIPSWLFYVLSSLGLILFLHAIFWIDGAIPVGSMDYFVTANAFFVVYWLVLYHYLTRVGSRSLAMFRPLLPAADSDIPSIDYRLSTLPQRLGWASVLLGILFSLREILPAAEPFGDLVPHTPLPILFDVLATMFIATTFFCLIFRSVRQLAMVRRLHAQARNINLLKLQPAHAFSLLTSRTGMGVILIFVFSYLLQPSAFSTSFDIIAAALFSAVAVAIFVLPIIGIRDQIERVKEETLDKVSDLLQQARDDLHARVIRRAYDDYKGIEDTVEALVHEREFLEAVPTWPWNPRTIRGFASTLLLPILLWLATRLLERLL